MINTIQQDYLVNHPSLGKDSASKIEWIKPILEPVLPTDRSAKILEIGPGRGELLMYLAKTLSYSNVVAIDNSKDVVDMCGVISEVSVYLEEDAAAYLDRNVQQFDLIVMYHVLEHLPKALVVSTLKAAKQSLRAGGTLVIGVPNAAAPIIGVDQQYFDFTHETAFSPWSLEQAIKMAGFKTVQVAPVWPPRGGIGRTLQRLLQKTIISMLRAYLSVFSGTARPVLTHSIVAYAKDEG